MRRIEDQIVSYCIWPKTQMGRRGSPAGKEKIGFPRRRLQILGQSFCNKSGENVSMGSWTMMVMMIKMKINNNHV